MVALMDWRLLLTLICYYTLVYSLGVLALIPGQRFLNRRFCERFPECLSVDELSAADREEWERTVRVEYDSTGYRHYEIAWLCFNYPSIIVLSAVLRRPTLGMLAMYLATGVKSLGPRGPL
jgi:hypothetical protein